MRPLELVTLARLNEHVTGRYDIITGLINGPVAMDHLDLVSSNVREVPGA